MGRCAAVVTGLIYRCKFAREYPTISDRNSRFTYRLGRLEVSVVAFTAPRRAVHGFPGLSAKGRADFIASAKFKDVVSQCAEFESHLTA